MNLFLYLLGAAYRQDPTFVIFLLTLSLAAGIGLGFRILGPLLFG